MVDILNGNATVFNISSTKYLINFNNDFNNDNDYAYSSSSYKMNISMNNVREFIVSK